jgi:hypothetical protein
MHINNIQQTVYAAEHSLPADARTLFQPFLHTAYLLCCIS